MKDGLGSDGKPRIKYFSGKTTAEVRRKIREYNKAGSQIDKKNVTVKEYILDWLTVYKKDALKQSSYDRLENTVQHQIIPNIGMIPLQQLTSKDIQKLLNKLKKDGLSYSTIKKVYDCLNDVLRHAAIEDDIAKSPMLTVNMLKKEFFEQSEIEFFSREETALFIEECGKRFKNGTLVYGYGDVYVLMLNTGIRMGEAIGLLKSDWNKKEKTLHIQRNVQSVMKRNENGERVQGRELIYNTTKTYSGDRIIPLNENAENALKRLCDRFPDSKYIVCQRDGEIPPPDRIERTFYRILKNLNIEKRGTHSLRHTFASMLFANDVDIKTISKLLGHASIQITLNTYIHLFDKTDHNAVAKLDSIF